VIQAVWNKGKEASDHDPNIWRKDRCTAWMYRIQYGVRDSIYGWEIDYINSDGGDKISNLQPLQWQNKLAKSEGNLDGVVKSDGTENVKVG
jgi:hypothetical protein